MNWINMPENIFEHMKNDFCYRTSLWKDNIKVFDITMQFLYERNVFVNNY